MEASVSGPGWSSPAEQPMNSRHPLSSAAQCNANAATVGGRKEGRKGEHDLPETDHLF